MASATLTDARVRALNPRKSVPDIRDGKLKGFGVRVMPSGAKRRGSEPRRPAASTGCSRPRACGPPPRPPLPETFQIRYRALMPRNVVPVFLRHDWRFLPNAPEKRAGGRFARHSPDTPPKTMNKNAEAKQLGYALQGTTALTLCPRFGNMIAPQSRTADCPEKNGAQARGKHHDSQFGRRCEDSPPGSGGGPRPIHGRRGTADPAGCGWPKTEFPEPRKHHPFALRAGQRCGSGIACARTWT